MNFSPSYEVSFWFRTVLVPVDGSENSMRALDLAKDFSLRYGSRITILTVCVGEKCPVSEDEVRERIGNEIGFTFKRAKINGLDSSPSNEILREIAEVGYDVVILGARGSSINSELNIGSVATSVSINSTSTVILVR